MVENERGYISKGVGGFYTVCTPSGEEIVCKARGRFRKDGITPVCGDRVLIARQRDGHALIDEILPRKNLLARPPVANIDQLIIVLSAGKPQPDYLLLDKLLIAASFSDMAPLIVFNKVDTVSQEQILSCGSAYEKYYPVLYVSAADGTGMDALKAALSGRISCFAGQSAVGKSSLLNTLLPELDLPVGGLTRKTDRGRHTTRHAELWRCFGGAVLDTAGFSLLELELCTQETLNAAYREFQNAPKNCRFSVCAHDAEPDCAVKALVENGSLDRERYERYVQLHRQFEEMRKRQYD